MKRRASDLPWTVEGRCLAVPSDADCTPFEPIARFKHEGDAKMFMMAVNDRNGEEASIDRVHTCLKSQVRLPGRLKKRTNLLNGEV
jgi:hypothetical protein